MQYSKNIPYPHYMETDFCPDQIGEAKSKSSNPQFFKFAYCLLTPLNLQLYNFEQIKVGLGISQWPP